MKCCNSKTLQRQNVAVVNRYKVKMLQYKTSQQTKRWVDAVVGKLLLKSS
jgi:hypothetical protein